MRVNSDDRQCSYAFAWDIYMERHVEYVALLRVNNRYGRVGVIEFRDAAKRIGKPVVLEMRFSPGARDFSMQLERIRQSPAEAIVIWANADEAGHIVRQMREMQMEHLVFGSDRLIDPAFLQAAGSAAEGTVAVLGFNPEREDEMLRAFKEVYWDRFGEEPESQAAHAYDAMNMILASVRDAGLNRTRIRDALLDYSHYDGVTGRRVFDSTWNNVAPVYYMQVRQGAFRIIGAFD